MAETLRVAVERFKAELLKTKYVTLWLKRCKMINVTQNSTSEVARIRAQIEAECQALHHLCLFSHVGSHEIVSARYKSLDAYHQELRAILGESEATSTIVALYNEVVQ